MSDKQKLHTFTLGIEEEFQIVDPETRELRSYVQQILDDEQRPHDAQGKRQGRDAPVRHRTGHGHLRQRGRGTQAGHPPAQRPRRPRRKTGPQDRLRRHPPVFALGRPAHHGRRTLQDHRAGFAAGGAGEPDLRPARPRRHPRPRVGHPGDEPGALLPAAPVRAVGELALLARAGHGVQGLPPEGVRAVPAHGDSRCVREHQRVRRLSEAAGQDGPASTTPRRSGGTSGCTRFSTPSNSASAMPRAGSTTPSRSPRSCRPSSASSTSCSART